MKSGRRLVAENGRPTSKSEPAAFDIADIKGDASCPALFVWFVFYPNQMRCFRGKAILAALPGLRRFAIAEPRFRRWHLWNSSYGICLKLGAHLR
jgi:hypothetical protein